jgi:hypothetical protein
LKGSTRVMQIAWDFEHGFLAALNEGDKLKRKPGKPGRRILSR